MKAKSLLCSLAAGLAGLLATGTAQALTLRVVADNALASARPSEVVTVPWAEITKNLPGALPDSLIVKDSSGNTLVYQFTNFHPEDRNGAFDDVLFQHDFAAGEKQAVFTIEKNTKPTPPSPSRVFARYVPERMDDFAFENDRIAHRIYGPALNTPAAGKSQLRGSGIDFWAKKVHYLVVDRWYLRGHNNYHKDTGEGLDLYSVGTTRGVGGTGIWDGKTLHTSDNWASWKVLANGPIRAVFELSYGPWQVGEAKVSELKRFTVDAGKNVHQIQSTYTIEGGPAELTAAVGIGRIPKVKAVPTLNKEGRWMTRWSTYEKEGLVGVGVAIPSGIEDFVEEELNQLALFKVRSGSTISYLAGAAWDQAGDITTSEAWNAYLADSVLRANSPLKISVSAQP